MSTAPQAYRVEDAARLLECSPSLIYKLVKEGRLQHFKLGRLIRIPRPVVEGILCGSLDIGESGQYAQSPEEQDIQPDMTQQTKIVKLPNERHVKSLPRSACRADQR